MPCILCNKEIQSDETTLEVYTTDNQTLIVHRDCYEEYVKSMAMCGSGCSGCSGCG